MLFPIISFGSDSLTVIQNQILLDHVNIAVPNLEEAKTWYLEKLGFSVKQGRLHQNSILNAFIEFENGTELELITAAKPKDELAKWYINFIEQNPKGAGAFAAFKLEDKSANLLKIHLKSKNIKYNISNTGYSEILSFPKNSFLYNLFFIRYFQNVENEKIYTHHLNSAKRLHSVWLTKRPNEQSIMNKLGFFSNSKIKLPYFENLLQNYTLKNGQIYLFSTEKKVRVFGVTIEVGDIHQVKKIIEDNLQLDIQLYNLNRGKSFILSPENTYGVWMEFLEMSK